MSTLTRCMAVDDHPTVRQGLGLMFGLAPDLELVGSVENGEDEPGRPTAVAAERDEADELEGATRR